MPTPPIVLVALRNRLALALTLVAVGALAAPATTSASPAPSVIAIRTVTVGAPGNPSVGRRPVTGRDLHSPAPKRRRPTKHAVPGSRRRRLPLRDRPARGHRRPVGRLPQHGRPDGPRPRTTSTARPRARRPGRSSARSTSPPAPRAGRHYSVASPEWADKPYGFANFLRAARFANSLYNGKVLSKTASSDGGFNVRHLPGAALAADRARHVRHAQRAPATRAHKARLRHPQPGRVDQGRLLRPQRRRHVLLLEVPDQPRRLRRRHRDGARPRRRSTRPPATSPTPPPSRWRSSTPSETAGPELVPGRPVGRRLRDASTPSASTRQPTQRPTRAASARSARR